MLNVRLFCLSARSEGKHAPGGAQQLVPGRRPDGRPVLLHQPVLYSHGGHPPTRCCPISGPAPDAAGCAAAPGTAARSNAPEGQPAQPARATQPTHQHRSGHEAVFYRRHIYGPRLHVALHFSV